jgi:phosphoribosylformylglycinamidine synthase
MPITFGVLVFPGSNCDHDAYHAAKHVFGQAARFIWHEETALGDDVDVVIVPGGFAHGDYLRAGAIARFSPIMQDVVRFAEDGGLVFGICNGFQVLCEAGLLPGTLMRNEGLRFLCKNVHVRCERPDTPFTRGLTAGQTLTIPISHGEGNYYADEAALDRLEADGRVVFRYCDADGHVTPAANPNGSARHIAGIVNAGGNVLGLMPHPERCVEALLGAPDARGDDGKHFFLSLIDYVEGGVTV